MEHVNAFKGIIAVIGATLTALWGWFGWLVLVWVALMTIDYATGTFAGTQKNGWNSEVATKGLQKKVGSIIAVIVAALADMLIGLIIANIPILMPFEYTILICPLVVVWYALTEAGSILENLVAIDVPMPSFFVSIAKSLKLGVEKTADKIFVEEKKIE